MRRYVGDDTHSLRWCFASWGSMSKRTQLDDLLPDVGVSHDHGFVVGSSALPCQEDLQQDQFSELIRLLGIVYAFHRYGVDLLVELIQKDKQLFPMCIQLQQDRIQPGILHGVELL